MTYRLTVTLDVDADSAEDARSLLERPLDELFAEPCVISMEADVPTWVPARPASFAERYPEAAA